LSLPGGLAMLQEIANERPQQVALLLPLSGPLEKTGRAIRDGFMAAYYESLNKGFPVPRVRIYDNQQLADVNAAYAQAQFDGIHIGQLLVVVNTHPRYREAFVQRFIIGSHKTI